MRRNKWSLLTLALAVMVIAGGEAQAQSYASASPSLVDSSIDAGGLDFISGDEGPVVGLEVYDLPVGEVITDRAVARQAWTAAGLHQAFGAAFTLYGARTGHPIEFWTDLRPHAYVRVDKAGSR